MNDEKLIDNVNSEQSHLYETPIKVGSVSICGKIKMVKLSNEHKKPHCLRCEEMNNLMLGHTV